MSDPVEYLELLEKEKCKDCEVLKDLCIKYDNLQRELKIEKGLLRLHDYLESDD